VVRYIPPLATADRPQGYPVRAILFVTYEASGGSRTSPVSKADAMAALLKEAKNHRERLTLRGFRTLAAIVREAECLELRFADSRAAAHLIQAGLDD
jgi:hypothetical protein